jgi:hypothetical protein
MSRRATSGTMSIVTWATSHQSRLTVRAGHVQKTYVHRLRLAYPFSFQQYVCFSVSELSEWPSIGIDELGREGKEGRVMTGYAFKYAPLGKDFAWMFKTLLIKAVQGFLIYFSNPVSEFSLTYHHNLDENPMFNVGS